MGLLRRLFRKTTIYPQEWGIKLVEGRPAGQLEPGSYRLKPFTEQAVVFDRVPLTLKVASRDYSCQDMGILRAYFSATVELKDVEAYYAAGGQGVLRPERKDAGYSLFRLERPENGLSAEGQAALVAKFSSLTLLEAVAAKEEALSLLTDVLTSAAQKIGMEVTRVLCVAYEPTGPARTALSDLLKAELEGQVAMKRARNEQAVLRSLLNTSRLVRENPGLLELRILTSGQKPRVAFTVSSPASPGTQSPQGGSATAEEVTSQ